MGKSPGKWIKTLLFGKKTSKSNLSKGRDVSRAANETWVAAKAPGADLAVDPPLISHLAPGPTDKKEGNSEKGVPSNLSHDDDVLPGNQDIEGTAGSDAPNDPERIRQEQAATKAQAAFRGYLARRAFRALKGIIRLQALVRGHLVRRQAVATLRCMQGIVKLQALVRGRRVRLSDTGLELRNKFSLRKPLEAKSLELIQVNIYTRSEKLSANAFVRKLLASSSVTMPLHLQYGPGEPNSAWNWLERWTSSRFWEPLSQAKTVTGSKSQVKKGNLQTAETKPGRPKRSVRRVPAANIDNGSINSTSESEKPKRNIRKVTSHPVDSVQENPQNELEKVKRSLRKVSSTTVESSDRLDVENEKLKRTLGKVSSSQAPDISDQAMGDSAEKMKKDTTEAVSSQPDIETTPKPLTAEDPVDDSADNHSAIELQPLESSVKEENISVTNGELSSKEDQASNENQKIGRRRASLPAKQEYPENGLQNTPKLPSYMSSTESAKAKFRGQGSPRFAQDVAEKNAEKNGFTRRHSLPSSTNGILSSLSPRTQRLAQASGKGGIRDRSLLSSRDGNDKVVQAEWRR